MIDDIEKLERFLEEFAAKHKGFQYRIVSRNHRSGVIGFKTSLIQIDVLKEMVSCPRIAVWYYRGKWLLETLRGFVSEE